MLAGTLLQSGFATLGLAFGALALIATLLFAAILQGEPSRKPVVREIND